MPQLHLYFNDIPIPETHLWEQFEDEQTRIVIETLADASLSLGHLVEHGEFPAARTTGAVPGRQARPPGHRHGPLRHGRGDLQRDATACHAQSKRDTRRPSSLPGRGLDRDHGQGGQSAARDVVVFHHGRLRFWRSNRVENAVTITRLPAPDTESDEPPASAGLREYSSAERVRTCMAFARGLYMTCSATFGPSTTLLPRPRLALM